MKNKSLIKVFSVFALIIAFAGCANNQNNTEGSATSMEAISSVESNDQTMKENNMSTESDDPKAASNKDMDKEDKTLHEDGGEYVTTLLASHEGKPIEDIDFGTIYEVKLEEDKLLVKGTLNYREEVADHDNQVLLEGDEHSFKLADDVVFQAVGGTAPPQIFTREEFIEYEKGVEESGLALIIQVKDGLVKYVSISS